MVRTGEESSRPAATDRAAVLRVIPRMEKAEFDCLDPLARWLVATRTAVHVMTFLSATLGGLFILARLLAALLRVSQVVPVFLRP